jgi:very-short-patch-repair endonuclease
MCGCKEETNGTSVFVRGHEKRFSKLLRKVANRPDVRRRKSKHQKRTLAKRKKENPKKHKLWLRHLRKAMKKRFNREGMREWYSEMMAAKWNDPEFVEAYTKASPQRHASLKEAWANCTPKERAAWVSNAAAGAATHPNSKEYALYRLLKKYFPGKFVMNVVECATIGSKIPDFICTTGPLVIELFGTYWHGRKKTGRKKHEEENRRIEHFRKHDIETLIIWEDELEHKRSIKKKIVKALRFIEE